MSLPFHFLDSINLEILNTISTNIWLNIFFFFDFFDFAFFLFGYYELTLPDMRNRQICICKIWRIHRYPPHGTHSRHCFFFMYWSYPCLSVGRNIIEHRSATQLTAGMSGFGLALALPLACLHCFQTSYNYYPNQVVG